MSVDSIPLGEVRSPSRVLALLRQGKSAAVWLCLVAVAASALYPIFFLFSTALRTKADYEASPGGFPQALTTDHVSEAFSAVHFGSYALNSLLVVVPAVAIIAVLSSLASYALIHFNFPLRKGALVLVVLLMAVPPAVILIPIFKVILDAGLLNDRLGLILVYAALNLPFSIYLLASFMKAVPSELLNAAKIDGAGALRTLWSVVLPLVRPGLLTLLTLNFLFLWNEFLYSLVLLQTEGNRTIMVGIAQLQGRFAKDYGLISAGLLLSMIPPLLIFVFFQRDLARGLTAGAVK
ncbi:MAG: carbohydrate ABC transporter permease [Actinobacteria bacterium]|nr:carbohydrate ABC transporter permease [Actinomycetota bacterium]